ncbi:MAG: HU family DNA-binding protein [Pirellulales bacterium]|jgi:nucleoid DNA-binding protein|nr:HU family DNA-binding protein [Pirellulales bacterium]
MAKAAAQKKPLTKSQIFTNIAEATGLTRKQVAGVFDALTEEIRKAMSSRGPGVFQVPGLIKVVKKYVPARKAQKNVPNPFKPGEFMDRPAKPASYTVKVRALKALKSMVK